MFSEKFGAKMRLSVLSAVSAALTLSSQAVAQTYSSCDPMDETDCPADTALDGSATFDFTQGASSNWTATGTVDYSSTNGAAFTVAEEGDAPLITSNFYIMWGHVETVLQAANGTGIVSTVVMQSDTLDEIDIEFLGGDDTSVQTNYFGHADTDDDNREQTISMANNQDGFHTYTVDWTAEHIVWQIDGTTVRSMTPESADSGQYPQTPMMIKIGIWAGGDPNNAAGTISWAGGETDYSDGPYTMYCKSISIIDYSTGTEFVYTSESGTADSVSAVDGSINGNIAATASVATDASAATVTSGGDAPLPWDGTHRSTSSYTIPDIWPWVATATHGASSTDPVEVASSDGNSLAKFSVSMSFPAYCVSISLVLGFLFPLWR